MQWFQYVEAWFQQAIALGLRWIYSIYPYAAVLAEHVVTPSMCSSLSNVRPYHARLAPKSRSV
ncbi:transmembrane protein, putative [Medicago truncatula]|uniref:Transmembrane protein, putative n=1 Tax=Medicago truncatula TaxID=3880 RepID=G7KRL4_MEDTR|nr:transmembrane protein, putative [Medicago truncatula]